MAVSYPVTADSSPPGAIAGIWLNSEPRAVTSIVQPGVRNGSGSQPRASEQFLRPFRHRALLQMLDELSGGLPLAFVENRPHGEALQQRTARDVLRELLD
ncbi:hypothetical protein [Bradyrhizobium sp.]|uniref:hypothetical protein n=1 Tax=Bradyrhizobium sp. TaxID=376 RepID=UPI003C49C417